jgi:hypothetical protein
MKQIVFLILFATSSVLTGPVSSGATGPVDNRIWATLLKKHVTDGRVDYDGFKQDEADLDRYLAILSATDPGALSHQHQLAFYINAYNAFTVKLILTRYPGINSIREIGSFFSDPWSRKFIPINRFKVSLDHIEHDILRNRFKDPRIHFALNCAARSAPPLSNMPYEGGTLETRLDDQTRLFINHYGKPFLKDNTLFVSRIFKWFEDDFSGNPLGFIRRYADNPLKQALEHAGAGGDIHLEYLDYDWTLNR